MALIGDIVGAPPEAAARATSEVVSWRESWLPDDVARANDGGIERVLV